MRRMAGFQGLNVDVVDMVSCVKAAATASGTEDEVKERQRDTSRRDS